MAGIIAAPAAARQVHFRSGMQVTARALGFRAGLVAADVTCGDPLDAAYRDEQYREVPAGAVSTVQRHLRGLGRTRRADLAFEITVQHVVQGVEKRRVFRPVRLAICPASVITLVGGVPG
jgi:hypothetical protein